MLSVLVVLICVFTVVGVAHIMELGSAAFFVVVVAGAMVLMCFFCGLIAYARARLLAVRMAVGDNQASVGMRDSVPVFYYLPTSNSTRTAQVDASCFWMDPHDIQNVSINSEFSDSFNDQCPICLTDIDSIELGQTGVSGCCRRPLHVQCAQKYFNTVQRVQCPLCRHTYGDV